MKVSICRNGHVLIGYREIRAYCPVVEEVVHQYSRGRRAVESRRCAYLSCKLDVSWTRREQILAVLCLGGAGALLADAEAIGDTEQKLTVQFIRDRLNPKFLGMKGPK